MHGNDAGSLALRLSTQVRWRENESRQQACGRKEGAARLCNNLPLCYMEMKMNPETPGIATQTENRNKVFSVTLLNKIINILGQKYRSFRFLFCSHTLGLTDNRDIQVSRPAASALMHNWCLCYSCMWKGNLTFHTTHIKGVAPTPICLFSAINFGIPTTQTKK